jgi:hypothetical protein
MGRPRAEIETLNGSTADVTLKEGKVELFIPLNRYIPNADLDPGAIEPVVLRVQPRDNEQRRLLSGRKVIVYRRRRAVRSEADRPTESDVEQSLVPITVERNGGSSESRRTRTSHAASMRWCSGRRMHRVFIRRTCH